MDGFPIEFISTRPELCGAVIIDLPGPIFRCPVPESPLKAESCAVPPSKPSINIVEFTLEKFMIGRGPGRRFIRKYVEVDMDCHAVADRISEDLSAQREEFTHIYARTDALHVRDIDPTNILTFVERAKIYAWKSQSNN